MDGSTDYNTGTADFRDWLRSTKQIEANKVTPAHAALQTAFGRFFFGAS